MPPNFPRTRIIKFFVALILLFVAFIDHPCRPSRHNPDLIGIRTVPFKIRSEVDKLFKVEPVERSWSGPMKGLLAKSEILAGDTDNDVCAMSGAKYLVNPNTANVLNRLQFLILWVAQNTHSVTLWSIQPAKYCI